MQLFQKIVNFITLNPLNRRNTSGQEKKVPARMHGKMMALLLATLAVSGGAAAADNGRTDGIPSVETLDLSKFEGTWYELSRIPLPIARDWVNTADIYIRNADGSWSVRYEGNKGSSDGPRKVLKQKLRIPDPARPGEMQVSFIPFIWMAYRLVFMSEDYRFMLVTSSAKKYLWLMSREPVPAPGEYEALVSKAGQLGFDTGLLERVPQEPAK